ncbi:MAG: hypothetical protein NZ480_01525, partial [Bdellovibrionaceae bacterium]|nr:hypothetical protein [Pseudobdellovibrionaceae bacterium]
MVKKIGLFISADHLLDEPSKLRTFLDQISRVFPQAHQMQLISIVDREQVASLKNIKWEHLTLLESPKRLKGRKAAKEAVKFLNHRPLDLITILRSQNKDSWSFWVGSFAETMVYFSQYPILIWPYLNYQIAKNFRCLYALDPHGCDVIKL